MIRFTCPHCDKSYKAKDEHAGRRIRCKGCDEAFVVEPLDEEQDSNVELEPVSTPRRRRPQPVDDDAEDSGGLPPRIGSSSAAKPKRRKLRPRPEDAPADAEDDEDQASSLQLIGGGVLLIAVGIGLYMWFAHIEQEGGRVRMHIIVIAIYKMLGKFGVLAVVGGLGLLSLVMGIVGLTKRR